MAFTGDWRHWRPNTKQSAMRDQILVAHPDGGEHTSERCHQCEGAIAMLEPQLGSKPFRFFRNVQGTRVEITDRVKMRKFLRYDLYEVHADMTRDASAEPVNVPAAPEPTPEPTPAVSVSGRDGDSQREAEALIRWIQRDLRPLAHRKSPDGKQLDEIGLRPAEDGAKMLAQGIPAAAIKNALTMAYPPEARRVLGVSHYDPTTFEPVNFGAVTVPTEAASHSGDHKVLPMAVAVARAGVPACFIGPKGTGKTTLAKAVTRELGLENFGMVSMTAGTSPSAFNGRPMIGGDGGVVQSLFAKCYREGGGFLFDEMDAAEPNLLLLVNAAIANGAFANSATGEMVPRSRKWAPMAAMNTLGLGAKDGYQRNKLDAATLDRWAAGRIEVALDEALERHVYWKTVAA